MSNPEFEPDILKGNDTSYSEKQIDLQIDTKGTVRQQVKQVNDFKGQQGGIITFTKKTKKQEEIIFKR